MSSLEENKLKGELYDNAFMSSLRDSNDTPNKRRRSQVNYTEADDDFDDEDDIPLSALASPSPNKKRNTSKTCEKTKPSKKLATKTTSSSTSIPTTKSTNSSANFKSDSDALYGSECEKGLLIQQLLCRWWYAIDWPGSTGIPDEPPRHFDPLDGFRGVFVCTEGEEVGAIQDFRDKATCPNFINMANKSAEELKDLLMKALTEQKRQLVEAEGKGTETEKELEKLVKWASKVNTKTADNKAEAVLKAAKSSLH
jgi:hypothetical protein